MNRTTNRTAALVALAGAAFSLTACGDATDNTSTTAATRGTSVHQDPAAVDPCTLPNERKLEQALGTSVSQTGSAKPAARGSACNWSFADPTGIPGSLSITTWHGTEFFSTAIGEGLDGLGDDARTDRSLGTVLFRSGDDVVQVQVLPSSRIGAAEAIAEQVESAL